MNNNIGLYIDGENIHYQFYNQLFDIIDKLKGKLIFKKLYCDFGLLGENGQYKNIKDYCLKTNIEQKQVMNNKGKNSSDMIIQFDIMKELENNIIDTYIIASGDADFINIVNHIKKKGKNIIGIGIDSTSAHLLKISCDTFMTLEKKNKKHLSIIEKNILELFEDNDTEQFNLSNLKSELLSIDTSYNEQNYNYKKFSLLIKDLPSYNTKFKIKNNEYLEIIN